MKRVKRNPEKFGSLELFSAIAREYNFRLDSTTDIDKFGNLVLESVKACRGKGTLLHGKRIESLFGFMAAALGKCRMIKVEDAGDLFINGIDVQAPDYRLILENGTQLLVEVKNFHSSDIRKNFVMTREYYQRIEGYAAMFATPLKIAIYFSKFNRWCLVSPDSFQKTAKGMEISFSSAMVKNEMISLGDVSIATLPELRLEMMGDVEEACEIDEEGQAKITFRTGRIFCGDAEITEDFEQRIAFYLMRFGRWKQNVEAVIQEGKLLGIIFRSHTTEVFDGQPFAIVGELSSMISEAYAEHTVAEGNLIAIDVQIEPEVLALSIPSRYRSKQLPLWRFLIEPNNDN